MIQWLFNIILFFSLSLRQPILEYGTILSMISSCQTVFSSLHCGIRRLERKDNIVSVKENLGHHHTQRCIYSHWTTMHCKDLSNTISMWSDLDSAYFGSNQYFLYAQGYHARMPSFKFHLSLRQWLIGKIIFEDVKKKDKGRRLTFFFLISRLSWQGRSLLSSCWIAEPIH